MELDFLLTRYTVPGITCNWETGLRIVHNGKTPIPNLTWSGDMSGMSCNHVILNCSFNPGTTLHSIKRAELWA